MFFFCDRTHKFLPCILEVFIAYLIAFLLLLRQCLLL